MTSIKFYYRKEGCARITHEPTWPQIALLKQKVESDRTRILLIKRQTVNVSCDTADYV